MLGAIRGGVASALCGERTRVLKRSLAAAVGSPNLQKFSRFGEVDRLIVRAIAHDGLQDLALVSDAIFDSSRHLPRKMNI